VAKPYRGFESPSLRHAVSAAENPRLYFPQNAGNMPVFRDSSSTNRTTENELLTSERGHSAGFSLEGTWTVRFHGGHQANAMRSKPGDSGIGVDFCPHLRNRFRYFPEARFWTTSELPTIRPEPSFSLQRSSRFRSSWFPPRWSCDSILGKVYSFVCNGHGPELRTHLSGSGTPRISVPDCRLKAFSCKLSRLTLRERKVQTMILARFFVVTVLLFMPASAFGWGCMGHQVIAMLAYQELNPKAKSMADSLLADLSAYSGLHHFCSQPQLPAFGIVSTWADDIRDIRPETAPWHFIDIPLSAQPSQYNSFCDSQKGCVTSAIAQAVSILRGLQATPRQRTEALIFLIHFVGDIHQPLHAETNNDRGGNCFPVQYFKEQPVEGKAENFKPNLHGVWDTEIVELLVGSHGGPASFVRYIQQKYHAQAVRWQEEAPNYMRWAAESHQAALSVAYGYLPAQVVIEQPVSVTLCSDDNHVSHRLAVLHEGIGSSYTSHVSPVIETQLARAGTRLAALLNHIWP
jgi:hypothetical protein